MQLSDLEGLRGCAASLEQLDLSGCRSVRVINALADHTTRLAKLALGGCDRLERLQPLAACQGLTELELSNASTLADLSPLASCQRLAKVDISFCAGVATLAPLAGCRNLDSLVLVGCRGLDTETVGELQAAAKRRGRPLDIRR